MSLYDFRNRDIPTANGTRTALVATPLTHVVLGKARLEELRKAPARGSTDEDIIDRVRSSPSPIRVLIFRHRSDDGKGSWAFDPAIADSDMRELAKRMVQLHLRTYARLFSMGVLLVAQTDADNREASVFRAAEAELAAEEEARAQGGGPGAALAQLNAWSLRTLSQTYTLGASRVLSDLLPKTLATFESTEPIVRQLIEALPPGSLD